MGRRRAGSLRQCWSIALCGVLVFQPVGGRAQHGIDVSHKLTLFACYQLAIDQSEALAISQQRIKEAEGRFFQSLSGALPKASFEYSQQYAHEDNTAQGKFTFSQPLFSGFKEFAAMAGAKAEGRQFQLESSRARELLFVDVADAFYYFASYQDDLASNESAVEALRTRVDELTKRVSLGRSRASELASAQARLSRMEADAEGNRQQMEVARELLEFLTGAKIEVVDAQNVGPVSIFTDDELESFVSNRLDVQAMREALAVADKKVAVAQAGFFPNVSLDGNYYTKKIIHSSSDWDVTLTVNVPLFQGGETFGKVKEAKALREQARLKLAQAKRTALLEIRQVYAQWHSSTKRAMALHKALVAAEQNYQLQSQDYHHNLVSNLDVLQALADLEDVRRTYIDIANESKRAFWNFKVKTGELSNVHF